MNTLRDIIALPSRLDVQCSGGYYKPGLLMGYPSIYAHVGAGWGNFNGLLLI